MPRRSFPTEIGPCSGLPTWCPSNRHPRIPSRKTFDQLGATERLFAVGRQVQGVTALSQFGNGRLEEAEVREMTCQKQDFHADLRHGRSRPVSRAYSRSARGVAPTFRKVIRTA